MFTLTLSVRLDPLTLVSLDRLGVGSLELVLSSLMVLFHEVTLLQISKLLKSY